MMVQFSPTTRIRTSPFYDSVVEDGLAAVTSYNNMWLPTSFGDAEAEYDRLVNGVALWDVAAERQVAIKGPDALALAQVLAPRKLGKQKVGQGKYVAICDHNGTLLNDPILLKVAEDEVWLSIASSDILFWARAIASERGFDVWIYEADASPLAVQGPLAEDVIADMFGEDIRTMKYFWFRDADVDGIPVKVARSGWSKQGGFEIYLLDRMRGNELYAAVKSAGASYGIGPGAPNAQERIESGLLSWGGDTDDQTNPFEVRMGGFVDLDVEDNVVGIQALRRIAEEGPKRHQLGLVMEGDTAFAPLKGWAEIHVEGVAVGHLTCASFSPKRKRNIGFALISTEIEAGARVAVMLPDGPVAADLTNLPFY